jgi:hypothetical protein
MDTLLVAGMCSSTYWPEKVPEYSYVIFQTLLTISTTKYLYLVASLLIFGERLFEYYFITGMLLLNCLISTKNLCDVVTAMNIRLVCRAWFNYWSDLNEDFCAHKFVHLC